MALCVLEGHPAVLDELEPWILVESLGSATVNLCTYFWLDGSRYSWQKVKPSVIRLVKRAYHSAGIEIPGQVRELVLPARISVELYRAEEVQSLAAPARRRAEEADMVSTDAEAGLHSEEGQHG